MSTIFDNGGSYSASRGRTVDLAGRVVTRDQLSDATFFDLVKPELLTGQVEVIDPRVDRLQLGDGSSIGFDDPAAAVALAKSQTRWIGNQPSAPVVIFDTLGVDWLTNQVRDATQGG